MSNCFKSVRILKNERTGTFFAKAVTCGSLGCPYCREQIKDTLTTKILYAVNKYNLKHFFTLTTSMGIDELNEDFETLRKKMDNFKKSNFIAKMRGSQSEREEKYKAKVHEMVEFEIKTMFYIAFIKEEAIALARKQGVIYMDLDSGENTFYTSKNDFISKNYNELISAIEKRLESFKNGSVIPFTPIIKGKQVVFRSYGELYKYCYDKVTQNDDEKFSYIRILEVAGKPHYHILCNRYICHYIIGTLFRKDKKTPPKVGQSDKIYLNVDLQEFTDFETEIQAQEAVTKYVTMYITKELYDGVEQLKSTYKGKKRIDIIKSSQNIDVALNTKFNYGDEEKDKYIYIDTFDKVPRCTWEEIVGATDYRGYQKYLDGLQNPEDYQENPFILAIRAGYKDYCDKVAALRQQLQINKRNSNIEDWPSLLIKYKEEKRELDDAFKRQKNYLETACLKDALNKKLSKPGISIKVSIKYLAELETYLIERKGFSETEKSEYLKTQENFVQDLQDPNKKIIFLLGGAGSGKTTTIANIYTNLSGSYNTEFCALSAKAATVLSSKGLDGKTIHRLCKARYSLLSDFMANENNPLDVDILFIDEISMVTKFDFALLLNALPDHAKIICSGDDNQLNAVGSNSIIYEFRLLKHKAISFHFLNLNFRSDDRITLIANEVRNGNLTSLDFKKFDMEKIYERINQGYQVITNGRNIAEKINLYASRNNTDIVCTAFYNYSRGQEVMILRNDPKNGVYNGNICKIIGITETKKSPRIILEKSNGEQFFYSLPQSATHFVPSYAFTVHKSQGSEFDKVVIVLDNKSMLLNRNMLYTAITRAKYDFEIYVCDGVDINLLKEKQENDDPYTLLDIIETESKK